MPFQANQDLLEKVICCLKKLLENQNRIRLKFCLICLKKLLEKPRIRGRRRRLAPLGIVDQPYFNWQVFLELVYG